MGATMAPGMFYFIPRLGLLCLLCLKTCHALFRSRNNPVPGKTGAWQLADDYAYYLDKGLANNLAELFSGNTVLELGAGKGHYKQYFLDTGKVKTMRSFDGAPNIAKVTDGFVEQADLTQHLDLPVMDWVMCSEVGEHIPKKWESAVLDNVVRHSRMGVVLSWGLPKQSGIGHVNMLTNMEVTEKMKDMGFCLLRETSHKIRMGSDAIYFKQTPMVFVRSSDGPSMCKESDNGLLDKILASKMQDLKPDVADTHFHFYSTFSRHPNWHSPSNR